MPSCKAGPSAATGSDKLPSVHPMHLVGAFALCIPPRTRVHVYKFRETRYLSPSR